HFQLQGQSKPLALRLLVGRRQEPDRFALIGPLEPEQLLRRQKRTGRTATNKMPAPLPDRSQIKVAGETAIIDLHIPRLQVFQLLESQRHLAHRAGFQPCVQADSVEQIINDRQASLWIAGAGGPVLVGGFFPAKGLAQLLALRQTHQGTIDAKESVSPPALDGVLQAIDRWQYA